ncbi:MAG TPA: sulfotransferase [Burkholderiaceae bacterium]
MAEAIQHETHAQLLQALALHQAGNLEAAKAAYLQILAREPRNADAHHLLGCALRAERKFNEAIECIGTAISINPLAPSFYNNLGTCYSAKVERVAAELCFRKALDFDPNYADAWSNLGLMHIGALRFQEARLALEQGREAAPGHEGIQCNLAHVYHELGLQHEALTAFELAVKQFPASGVALIGLAGCLNKAGRNEEALAAVEKLLTLGPRHEAEAWQLKGRILEVLGRLDEACAAFDRAIAAMPDEVGLMHARASIKKVEANEPFFAHLTQFEKRAAEVRGTKRIQLHFALGKAYRDIGNVAASAGNYAQGASMQLLTSNYDEREDVALFKLMHERFNEPLIERLKGQGHESSQPIFVLGMPRSGTTLVEQILASHPQVCAAGELPFVSEVLDGFGFPGGWRLGNGTGGRMPAGISLCDRAQAYLQRVYANSSAEGRPHFTDKLPENYYNLGFIAAMFPNARIIHCRRDPVDTSLSCYQTLFASKHYWSYDLAFTGRTYRRYWQLMQHWRDVLPGRFIEMRYEQVVEDIEQQARRLLDWCGLPWDDRVLRFYETERPVQTASVTQVRQPIYSSSVGKWKKWEPYIQPLLGEIGDIEKAYWDELGNP